MQQFQWMHAAWLAIAIVLEIIANVFLKFSTAPPRSTAYPWRQSARSAPCRRRLKESIYGAYALCWRRYRGDHRRRLGAVWSASE